MSKETFINISELNHNEPEFESFIRDPQRVHLGDLSQRHDIPSTKSPFTFATEYKAAYPETIKTALGKIYSEYNRAFIPLVDANREWSSDYQYCMTGINSTPVNYFVQIDMVGLPDNYLAATRNLPSEKMQQTLKKRIFEIENSLAMYGLMRGIFKSGERESAFKNNFDYALDSLRNRYHMPIALLAVTEQKHQAMRETEFGKQVNEALTDDEVKQISGFDKLFGPADFIKYLEQNNGECNYLLYARTSDPVDKLKKPGTIVENPLLENDEYRRIIKANAITLNIDNPKWEAGSPRRINDTKAYLPIMGMAHQINTPEDAWRATVVKNGQPPVITLDDQLEHYLSSQGITEAKLKSGQDLLRAKPMQASYGCYGHISVRLDNGKHRQEVRKGLKERGPYLIQPEMQTPVMINITDGQTYTYIDRNFYSIDGENLVFMGGFRSLMPLTSQEAQQKRVHGNSDTVWAEIDGKNDK